MNVEKMKKKSGERGIYIEESAHTEKCVEEEGKKRKLSRTASREDER